MSSNQEIAFHLSPDELKLIVCEPHVLTRTRNDVRLGLSVESHAALVLDGANIARV